MKRLFMAGLLLLLPLGMAQASPLFSAVGEFSGTGRISPKVEAPLGRAKCKLQVTRNAPNDVNITGRCVLVGGSTNVSMRFVKAPNKAVRGGVWSPSTDESVQFEGTDAGNIVRLQTVAPVDVEGVLYDSIVTLEFTSANAFAMEQLVRKIGDEAWLRVVDMIFEQEG